MKWIKKPVVIEAEQWDGSLRDMERIKKIFPDMLTLAQSIHEANDTVYNWKIETLEGGQIVSRNDFIIKGVKGEYYPMEHDIFLMTYELVK